MKKITCKEMGGSCDTEITGTTAEEMASNGKQHVHDLADSGDADHQAIVEKMKQLSEDEYKQWMVDFSAKFDSLEDA